METIWMIQKPTAMGNRWLAASSWKRAHSCIMSHAEFFGETSNHSGDSALPQPRFGALWLLDFLKTKIIFARVEISDCWWDSEKYDGAADGDWENCVRSQGAHFEGDWGIIVLYTMFPVSYIFFNKCLYFYGWIPSGQTLYMVQMTISRLIQYNILLQRAIFSCFQYWNFNEIC